MSINLQSATLAQLVAHYNAIPGIKPVTKFTSKAAGIQRIESALMGMEEPADLDEPPLGVIVGVEAAQVEEPVAEVQEVESVETEIEDAPVEPDAVETSGLDPAADEPVAVLTGDEFQEAYGLTELQYRLLDAIAHSQWSPVNMATPTTKAETGTWYYADVFAGDIGCSEQAVGGITTSLTEAGLITVFIEADPKESVVDFTDEGFKAWQDVHSVIGSLPRLTSEEPTSPAAPTASGFTYKTRDELKALAEVDPEGRAAYRAARRLAARKARKAKKAVPAA